VNPAVLNNQINTLALRFGGPSFDAEGVAQVMFEDLSALVGDYNENGVVDAADYTVWRNKLGQPGTALPNRDPSNSGAINDDDYDSWKASFGATAGAGSASGAGSNAVPEPATGLIWIFGVSLAAGARIQRAIGAG
jgi:hypothetical protein